MPFTHDIASAGAGTVSDGVPLSTHIWTPNLANGTPDAASGTPPFNAFLGYTSVPGGGNGPVQCDRRCVVKFALASLVGNTISSALLRPNVAPSGTPDPYYGAYPQASHFAGDFVAEAFYTSGATVTTSDWNPTILATVALPGTCTPVTGLVGPAPQIVPLNLDFTAFLQAALAASQTHVGFVIRQASPSNGVAFSEVKLRVTAANDF